MLRQITKAIEKVRLEAAVVEQAHARVDQVEHYRALLLRVVDQTQRRVFNEERVPASEKIVSFFEPHTTSSLKANGTSSTVTKSTWPHKSMALSLI